MLIEQPFEWDGMAQTEAGYGFGNIDTLVAAFDKLAVAPSPALRAASPASGRADGVREHSQLT